MRAPGFDLTHPNSAQKLPLDLLSHDYEGLAREFRERWGKGEYHSGAVFRQVHQTGKLNLDALTEFDKNPAFRETLRQSLTFSLPPLVDKKGDGDTYKFLLKLPDGMETESVVIPMRHYKTLCVSSQIGCKRGCVFCETAQMGFLKNLKVPEILAQVMTARHLLGEPVANVVFMGMGEPMDNLDNVLQAIRVMSEQRGLGIPKSAITISTVGNVAGIDRLAELARSDTSVGGFSRLRLAISLNAPNDEIRSRLMPINRQSPLAELKEALRDYPLKHRDDFFLMEYVLIPGVNDAREHALEVAEYLRDLRACVNLIPYNPRSESPFERATREDVERFFRWLMDAGQYCRVRGTKGQDVMAACGQLGNPALRRGRKETE